MTHDDEPSQIARRLRWGKARKCVFVRDEQVFITGAGTDLAVLFETKRDWSLAGVYTRHADPEEVMADIIHVRDEQRELRRAMRNACVRA